MTTISAKVIKDSICAVSGKRALTILWRYPRFIHAEVMTHRVFSRNASSSRAIPVERMIADILNDTAMPIHWGANQRGMQAEQECNEQVDVGEYGGDRTEAFNYIYASRENAWLNARNDAIRIAEGFHRAGYHKQVVNRLLEPFMHINVLVTATEWDNFLALRDHHAAEPHIQMLARATKKVIAESTPLVLLEGQWHLPFVEHADWERVRKENYAEHGVEYIPGGDSPLDTLIKISVARCARLSYNNFEGKVSTTAEDLALYAKLVGEQPIHASPAEHQLTPDPWARERSKWGNMRFYKQYRKTLPGETYDKDQWL